MKYGVVFPQTEIGADPSGIRDFSQAAEELGYDYLLAFDHVLGANPDRPGGWNGPYTYRHAFHEPFILFSYLAGITSRIEFTTGILILPQRQTVLVAKQAAQLDLLSNGRLRLGIGVGWNEVEYQSLNENFNKRGKRQAEQVELLRLLWTQELVEFRGEFHVIPDAGINPLPIQRPIPTWFGGSSDIVLRRMAKLGDGWIPNSFPLDKLSIYLETLRSYLEEERRDPVSFGIDYHIVMKDKSDMELAQEVDALHGLEVSHICAYTMGAGLATPLEHIQAIERFWEVLPKAD